MAILRSYHFVFKKVTTSRYLEVVTFYSSNMVGKATSKSMLLTHWAMLRSLLLGGIIENQNSDFVTAPTAVGARV